MSKHKTVTVNQLHKMLAKQIEKGNGRLPVCVNKNTFRDNRESDGCVILPVDGLNIERIAMSDDDGGTATTKAGLEVTRRTAILYGTSGVGFHGVLSVEAVEDYIKSLTWSPESTDDERAAAIGNIRGFASHLRRMTS